jgi:hypothetical protein
LPAASAAVLSADRTDTIRGSNSRGWKVAFGGDEHFEVPEPLVLGG